MMKDESTEKMRVIKMITNYKHWNDDQKVYWIQSYLLHWITEEKIIEMMH